MFKVIIVDDEKIVRIAMQNIIDWESHGFKIISLAKDGLEALKSIENLGADLVITDLKMKGLNGIELIERLKENNFKGKILVLSNHGEYELVREAMKKGADDYLIKVTLKSRELEEIVDKFKENLEKVDIEKIENLKLRKQYYKTKKIAEMAIVREFLRDEISYEDFYYELSKKHIFNENFDSIVGACIYIDNYKNIYEEKIKDKNKLTTTIENIIKEEFGRVNMYFIPINNHKYIFLCKMNLKDLEEKIFHIKRLIALYLNINCSFIIINSIENLQDFKHKYKKVQEIISLKFYEKNSYICSLEDFVGFGDSIKLKKEVNDIILENIDLGYIDANKALIEEFSRRCGILKVNPKNLIKDVSFMCELIENNEYVNEEDKDGRELKYKLLKSNSLEDLIKNSSNLIEYINNRYIKNKEILYKKEVNEIINFVEKNIHKRITLVMVSKAVNLNESYLSRVFKNETGKNLMYFINELKMKKAKELLKNSDLLVKEVAIRVGMTDQFYFNRVFKKFYGVSPSKYKKESIKK